MKKSSAINFKELLTAISLTYFSCSNQNFFLKLFLPVDSESIKKRALMKYEIMLFLLFEISVRIYDGNKKREID
jgi:hypothetical protein